MHKFGHAFLLVFALSVTLPTESLPAETKAGVATSVENRVLGILRGNAQPLSVGSEVYMDQVVRTENESTTQLLLLDKTNISVGTRSEVVLDRFVFDPNRAAGDVVINATRGVFRFVTGALDHNSYHIKTPVATLGVRGTVVEFNIPADIDLNAKDPAKKVLEVLLKLGAVDVTLWNGELIAMNDPDKILAVYAGGGYNISNYAGSLYAAVIGDVTGALGRGAGGGAGGGGGTINPLSTPRFVNTGNSGIPGGGAGTSPSNFFTFTPGNSPARVSQPNSP